jgi:hypothetical protein
MYDFKHLEKFTAFVIERHQIWLRREAGQSAPWTKDKILAEYRFCNVYREFDRVTMWIRDNWRTPYEGYEHLWFDMVIARLVNHIDTLVELGEMREGWHKKHFIRVLHERRARGEKTFGSAYIVSTNGIAKDKAEYLAQSVLDPMWEQRDKLKPKDGDRIKDFYDRLMERQGMGSFMAAQVVADIKYVAPLLTAKDWWTFAASGPGSRRGLSYVMGFDPRMPWKEHEWKDVLMELSKTVSPIFKEADLPRLHNQDLQNCLCEFSKYRRTQLGTGRPKQKFVPFTGGE